MGEENTSGLFAEDYQDVAKVWVGQNYMRIPKTFFVSREQAAKVVETFCQSGGRDPVVSWVNHRDTKWVFFDPDD